MLTYNSSIATPTPYTQQQRSEALAGMRVKSPYPSYGRQQQDIMDALGGSNAAQFDLAATKANSDLEMEGMKAQQQMALSGLQQMAQGQQQQDQLRTQRLSGMNGLVSPLLQGLFS